MIVVKSVGCRSQAQASMSAVMECAALVDVVRDKEIDDAIFESSPEDRG